MTFAKVVGGTAGTIVGTILIPVPIVGSIIGGVIGTASGKILGGISGIGLSKIVEAHERKKREKIDAMTTVPALTAKLSKEGDFVRGLMAVTLNSKCESQIDAIVEEATSSESLVSSSALHTLFEQMICEYSVLTPELYQKAAQLSENMFSDSTESDYFVLSPIPDENAPHIFGATSDLLVLRWPKVDSVPWELGEEHVLDIIDLNINNKVETN